MQFFPHPHPRKRTNRAALFIGVVPPPSHRDALRDDRTSPSHRTDIYYSQVRRRWSEGKTRRFREAAGFVEPAFGARDARTQIGSGSSDHQNGMPHSLIPSAKHRTFEPILLFGDGAIPAVGVPVVNESGERDR